MDLSMSCTGISPSALRSWLPDRIKKTRRPLKNGSNGSQGRTIHGKTTGSINSPPGHWLKPKTYKGDISK